MRWEREGLREVEGEEVGGVEDVVMVMRESAEGGRVPDG
jgi:hypothetical protein